MKSLKKKNPNDYPIFSIRLSQEQKETLYRMLDDAKIRLNRGKKSEDRVITKNDIAYEAIKLGLPLVKRQK